MGCTMWPNIQTFLDFRKNDTNDFKSQIDNLRSIVLKDMRTINDVHDKYSNVIKLHLASEMEQVFSLTSTIHRE